MPHHHSHSHSLSGRNLFLTIILNVIIVVSQLIGGFISNSLALISDALHNFSDVIALFITWFAHKLSKKSAGDKSTFGYKRAEIIAALFNSLSLIGIGIFILYEAIKKIFIPGKILSNWVIGLAALSIILNFLSVLLIKENSKENINIKSAYLHLMTDVFSSLAVLIGGILMHYLKAFWIDPVVSIIIAVYIVKEAFKIVKTSIEIIMQFSPEGINIEELEKEVKKNKFIENIHHIHIWQLDEKRIFLEAHIDFKKNLTLKEITEMLEKLEEILKVKFKISHITFQPEFERVDDKSLILKIEEK